MRKIAGRCAIAPILVLVCVVAPGGCAIPQVPYRTTYEDPVNFVRLEPDPYVLPEWPPSAHNHPVQFSEETIRRLLGGLLVQEHRIVIQKTLIGLAPREPALRPKELDLLVPKLTEALAKAKWNERVTFYLSQPETSIKREITSGGIYLNGMHVHIMLANRRIMYGIPAYGMIYDKRYPMRPTGPKGFDLYFDDGAAVVEVKHSLIDKLLGLERDELVIDLARLQGPPALVRAGSDSLGPGRAHLLGPAQYLRSNDSPLWRNSSSPLVGWSFRRTGSKMPGS